MNDKLITDSGELITKEASNIYFVKGSWNELAQILCGLSRCDIIYDNDHNFKIALSKRENLIEFSKDETVPVLKDKYLDWTLINKDEVDYLRFEDLETKSSICAQLANDGKWHIRLWEPFGTVPGTQYYTCFFRGLGVIPPDLDWEDYYLEERSILELSKEQKAESEQPKVKSPDEYLAGREETEASKPSANPVITQGTPLQDYAMAIQAQP